MKQDRNSNNCIFWLIPVSLLSIKKFVNFFLELSMSLFLWLKFIQVSVKIILQHHSCISYLWEEKAYTYFFSGLVHCTGLSLNLYNLEIRIMTIALGDLHKPSLAFIDIQGYFYYTTKCNTKAKFNLMSLHFIRK